MNNQWMTSEVYLGKLTAEFYSVNPAYVRHRILGRKYGK